MPSLQGRVERSVYSRVERSVYPTHNMAWNSERGPGQGQVHDWIETNKWPRKPKIQVLSLRDMVRKCNSQKGL
jgi:hypothetical protein